MTGYRLKMKEHAVWLAGDRTTTADVSQAVTFVAKPTAALFLVRFVDKDWLWDVEPCALPDQLDTREVAA